MTDLTWSPQQAAAVERAKRWLDDPTAPQVHRLFGYAGTGKTTLARELANHAGPGTLSAAYTGKAASVMARKGLPGASTVHRLIYTPAGSDEEKLRELRQELLTLERVEEPERGTVMRITALRRAVAELEAAAGRPRFTLKSADESELTRAPLLVLDEVSMVPEEMALDLLSFGTRILCLGDPAQLPPVGGDGWFMREQPDTQLTEIHRQAQNNPILRLATAAREGRAIPRGEWMTACGGVRVTDRVTADLALAADQVLCGTNARRRAINARHRQLAGHLGVSPMPVAGEKLVCLRNDHEVGLLNGTQWRAARTVEDWEPGEETVELRVTPEEGGAELGVPAHSNLFLDDEQKPGWGHSQWFTWGYALTTHKAQGSEWDNVLVFDDWPRRDSHKQWLYTSITRASDFLTLVQM